MPKYGEKILDLKINPVSGKALPVLQGQVLRIVQEEDGAQCVDFNGFNLHDYKEHLDVDSIRAAAGFRPKKGDILFSNPPRYRPMYGIIEMADTCITDILGRTCHATLFEASYGFELHTNCQDTLAEAISEYRLTPDDVHHSFNMWMPSTWDNTGKYDPFSRYPNPGRKGDYVDLLALFDTLSVPVTCGGGDVSTTGNYSFKPIRVQILDSSDDSLNLVAKINARSGRYRNQKRTLKDFKVQEILTRRELRPDKNFSPSFINYPLKIQEIDIELTEQERDLIRKLVSQNYGTDEGDVVRRAVMTWYNEHMASSLVTPSWTKIPLTWLS